MDFYVDYERKDGKKLSKLFIGSQAWINAVAFKDAAKTFGCWSRGPYQTYCEKDFQARGNGEVKPNYPFR